MSNTLSADDYLKAEPSTPSADDYLMLGTSASTPAPAPSADDFLREAQQQEALSFEMPKITRSDIAKAFGTVQTAVVDVAKDYMALRGARSNLANSIAKNMVFGTPRTEDPKEPSVVIHAPEEEETAKAAPLTADDFLAEAVAQEASPFMRSVKSVVDKGGEGLKWTSQWALRVLGAEENAEVSFLRKKAGLSPKPDFMDNTYSSLLKEFGAPNSWMTEVAGVATSALLAPSTYLSFGTTQIAKIGGKTALSKTGQRVAQEITVRRSEEKLAEMAAKGKNVTDSLRNKVIQETQERVRLELVTNFGEVSRANELVKVGADIDALPKGIYDQGGIKFMGKTVVNGADVARAVDGAGLTKAIGAIRSSKLGEAAGDTYSVTKDTLGRMFIKNYAVDRDLVNAWEATEVSAREMYSRMLEETEKRFTRWGVKSPAQRDDFYRSVADAFGDKSLVGSVKSQAGDLNVQRAIDRWFGQGEFAGKKGVTEQLAKFAKLVEGDEAVNWFPGIDERFAGRILDPRIPAKLGPSERAFNRPRQSSAAQYVSDPVKAVALRRTQLAMANIQDRLYESIKTNKLGDPKSFASPAEAAANGYVPLIRPHQELYERAILSNNVDERKLGELLKDSTNPVYVKKEFMDQYRDMVTEPMSRMREESPVAYRMYRLIEAPTKAFKTLVTTPFAAFHFRNFTSNIALNAMKIGGHAVSPVLHKRSIDILRGVNMDQKFTNAIGERLTLKNVMQEANAQGLLDSGFVHDLGGDNLERGAQELWRKHLSSANPLSPEFSPGNVAGAPFAWGKKLGTALEQQAKLVAYMSWREKGLSPKVAAREVQDALFDYSSVTPSEQWFKLLIPFYTFSRKNLEFHLKTAKTNPYVISTQLKAMRDLGPTNEEWEELPDWQKNKYVTKFRESFATGYGLPFENILSTLDIKDDFLSLINPLARYPLERLAKRDFQSGRDIRTINAANEFGGLMRAIDSPKTPAPVKKALKEIRDFMGLKYETEGPNPDKIIGDPNKLHILRNSFTSRFQSTIGMLEKEDKSKLDTAARFLTGFIRVEPDGELALNNKKRKAIVDSIDRFNESNTARALQIYTLVGGREDLTDEGKDLMKDFGPDGAQSMEELEEAIQRREELIELSQELDRDE